MYCRHTYRSTAVGAVAPHAQSAKFSNAMRVWPGWGRNAGWESRLLTFSSNSSGESWSYLSPTGRFHHCHRRDLLWIQGRFPKDKPKADTRWVGNRHVSIHVTRISKSACRSLFRRHKSNCWHWFFDVLYCLLVLDRIAWNSGMETSDVTAVNFFCTRQHCFSYGQMWACHIPLSTCSQLVKFWFKALSLRCGSKPLVWTKHSMTPVGQMSSKVFRKAERIWGFFAVTTNDPTSSRWPFVPSPWQAFKSLVPSMICKMWAARTLLQAWQ